MGAGVRCSEDDRHVRSRLDPTSRIRALGHQVREAARYAPKIPIEPDRRQRGVYRILRLRA